MYPLCPLHGNTAEDKKFLSHRVYILTERKQGNLVKNVSLYSTSAFQRVIVRNANRKLLPQSYPIRKNCKGGAWHSELRDTLDSLVVPEV